MPRRTAGVGNRQPSEPPHSGARSVRSDESCADMKETCQSKERLDFSFSKTPVKMEAETEGNAATSQKLPGAIRAGEAGGTLLWRRGFQRKPGPTDSLISEAQPPGP